MIETEKKKKGRVLLIGVSELQGMDNLKPFHGKNWLVG